MPPVLVLIMPYYVPGLPAILSINPQPSVYYRYDLLPLSGSGQTEASLQEL